MKLNIKFDFYPGSVPDFYVDAADNPREVHGVHLSEFLQNVIKNLPDEVSLNHEYNIVVDDNLDICPKGAVNYCDCDNRFNLGYLIIEEAEGDAVDAKTVNKTAADCRKEVKEVRVQNINITVQGDIHADLR